MLLYELLDSFSKSLKMLTRNCLDVENDRVKVFFLDSDGGLIECNSIINCYWKGQGHGIIFTNRVEVTMDEATDLVNNTYFKED